MIFSTYYLNFSKVYEMKLVKQWKPIKAISLMLNHERNWV